MSLHARLGPSNKHWPKCAGSPREESGYEDIPGEAAISGTGSHLLLDLCLKNNVQSFHYDGEIIGTNHEDNPNGWLVDLERCERVQMALNYVARRVGELREQFPDTEVVVESESKSDPGGMFGRDDWWGTCDITISVIAGDDLCLFTETIDYKDGRMWVTVLDDTQLLSYLGGKLRPWIASGPDLVRPFNPGNVAGSRITIIQPRTNPPIRYEDMSPHTVMEKLLELNIAATATDDPEAPLTSGKHCQWCLANPKRGGHCTAAGEKSLATLEDAAPGPMAVGDGSPFEIIGQAIGDVTKLSDEKLAELADARGGIEAAFDKVDAELVTRLDTGHQISGYKMQPGRGKNVWNGTDEEIEKMLKGRRLKLGDVYPKNLISPAKVMELECLNQAQKDTIKKKFVSYIPGKKKLTKVARKQEKDVKEMFADVATTEISFF